jgi:hypothetical protein
MQSFSGKLDDTNYWKTVYRAQLTSTTGNKYIEEWTICWNDSFEPVYFKRGDVIYNWDVQNNYWNNNYHNKSNMLRFYSPLKNGHRCRIILEPCDNKYYVGTGDIRTNAFTNYFNDWELLYGVKLNIESSTKLKKEELTDLCFE